MTIKTQNTKHKIQSTTESGITLLLVMVILSALLSISIGIFNVVFGQIKISGDLADSFIAFYAADQAIEKMLYRDRTLAEICAGGPGNPCYTEGSTDVQSGGCYKIRVSKVSGITTVAAFGQYRCGATPSRVVKRGFQLTY